MLIIPAPLSLTGAFCSTGCRYHPCASSQNGPPRYLAGARSTDVSALGNGACSHCLENGAVGHLGTVAKVNIYDVYHSCRLDCICLHCRRCICLYVKAVVLLLYGYLAFTRYSFTPKLCCTSQSSVYCPFHLLCSHYCNTIVRRMCNIRPPPDPPYICHAPYNIYRDDIV